MKNFDSYYDPPEEPEAEYCEECGQEKTILENFGGRDYYECNNDFCPAKFTGDAKEMAQKLVDTIDTVSRLEGRVKRLKMILDVVSPGWETDFRFGSSNK